MPADSAYVPSVSSSTLLTADQLLHVRAPGKRVELVRGVLVVREPAGLRQGRVVATLSRCLMDHVEANGLGQVYAGDTGFTRSEEHTSELQSQSNLVCRLLLEKKKNNRTILVS